MKSWLGRCHLYQGEGADRVDYEAVVAVFCVEIEAFDVAVRAHLDGKDMRLLWSEARHPAGEWLARHPSEKHTADLARSVHERHPVEIGTLTQSGKAVGGEAQSYLQIEEIEGVQPLDAQMGAWPLKNVPDALLEPLFGQPEPTAEEIEQFGSLEAVPPMKTYAVIDAGKVQFGRSVIEECDMPFRCLFKGEAAEELRDVAPYLIELDPEKDFTRTLFTYNPSFPEHHATIHLWHKEPGIYLRSRATFDEMHKHLRKFTRIQDENKKWYYFRFWEGAVLSNYLQGFKHSENRISQMMFGDFGSMSCVVKDGEKVLSLNPLIQKKTSQKFLLTAEYKEVFQKRSQSDFDEKLRVYLADKNKKYGGLDLEHQQSLLQTIIAQANGFGIEIEQALADFAEASLALEKPLHTDEILKKILRSNHHELDRATYALLYASSRRPQKHG